MRRVSRILAAALGGAMTTMILSIDVSAQNIDCSVIKSADSRRKCEQGQAEAAFWDKERKRQKLKEEKLQYIVDETKDTTVNIGKCAVKKRDSLGRWVCVGKELARPKKAE